MRGEPIATAPKDGRTIIVGDDDVGEFVMRWNPDCTNPVFAGGVVGMWEMADGSATWTEGNGFGPSYWRHLNS